MDAHSRAAVVNRLWADAAFAELTSNRARADYALKNVLPIEKLQEQVKVNIELAKSKTAKSLIRAKQFKTEADALVKRANFDGDQSQVLRLEEALKAYTKAILNAPHSEPHLLAKLYARKSQVHTSKGEHEAALYSISIAIEILESQTTMPLKLEYAILRISALNKCKRFREAQVYLDQLLESQEDRICQRNPTVTEQDLEEMRRSIQMSIQSSSTTEGEETMIMAKVTPNQPYFSYKFDDRCTIKQSPVVGRHFVAIGDIEPNETLLEERPYCMVLSPEFIQKKCNSCFAELGYKFYPCSYCNEAVYCNQICARQAYEIYHRHECGIISALTDISNAQSVHVFRMIAYVGGPLQAFNAQRWLRDTAYSIYDYLDESSQKGLRESEKTQEQKSRAYAMSSSLIAHDVAHGHAENVVQTVSALEIAALLEHVFSFRSEKPSMDFFLDLAAMLVVDLRRIIFNVFGWQAWANENQSSLDHVAHAQCLVGSLINHSCVPNTGWEFTDNGVIQFVANRAIKEGEEITISYGTHSSQSYASRQTRLNSYYFACACPACYRDARKGAVLRCKSCSGPVPYNQSVNKEPQLSGKCLLCFSPYDDFDEAIVRLGQATKALNVMQGLASVDQSGLLLKRAVAHMKTVEELSLPSSEQVKKVIVTCSTIIETVGARQFEASFSLAERVELSLFMQRHLTESLDAAEMAKKNMEQAIPTLQFWFERLLSIIAEFSQNSKSFNAHESELWSATFAVHRSLKLIFDKLYSPATDVLPTEFCNQVLGTLIKKRIAANEQALKQSKANYGPGRLLLQGNVSQVGD